MAIEGPGNRGGKLIVGPWRPRPNPQHLPQRTATQDIRPSAEVSPLRKCLSDRIGLVFKPIAGGRLKYQGQIATIEPFEMAETPFTIGMMRKLLELEGDAVRRIFTVPDYSVDEIIAKSLAVVAEDVPEAQRDNCPLVCASRIEAEAISWLVLGDLPTEMQWERAAEYINLIGNLLEWTRESVGHVDSRGITFLDYLRSDARVGKLGFRLARTLKQAG